MSKLKAELVSRLAEIPGVTHQPWPDREDGFSTILIEGKEIAHFHNFNELDLKLGRNLIAEEGLQHNSNSVTHPNRVEGSNYIELRFNRTNNLAEVVRLVKLAVALKS